MQTTTRNIVASGDSANPGMLEGTAIRRVLICRPNHRLGNQLLITPLLQEVTACFPHAKIDLFVKGNLGPALFKRYPNVDRIIRLPRRPFSNLAMYLWGWFEIRLRRYDIVINVIRDSVSGRLSAQFAKSKYKFFGEVGLDILSKYDDHHHMGKYPVYSFRSHLRRLGYVAAHETVPSLDIKLGSWEIAEGRRTLRGLVSLDRRTICLFTYATGAKRYDAAWWEEFYRRLKSECIDCNIIEVLPVENVSQISFRAPWFYSRDVREIGALIANADVFIGADSGMMHLASSVQTPTVGLFKVTTLRNYEPYGNNSVGVDTTAVAIGDCVQLVRRILDKSPQVRSL